MDNINYHVSGFLTTNLYRSRFDTYFENTDKLAGVNGVNVYLYEEPRAGEFKPPTISVNFLNNGNMCEINIPFPMYVQKNSNLPVPPYHTEVFETISNVMTAADEQYVDEYISEHPNSAETIEVNQQVNWLKQDWKLSKNGNRYLKLEGHILIVFYNKKYGNYGCILDGKFGQLRYPEIDKAKIGLLKKVEDLKVKGNW